VRVSSFQVSEVRIGVWQGSFEASSCRFALKKESNELIGEVIGSACINRT